MTLTHLKLRSERIARSTPSPRPTPPARPRAFGVIDPPAPARRGLVEAAAARPALALDGAPPGAPIVALDAELGALPKGGPSAGKIGWLREEVGGAKEDVTATFHENLRAVRAGEQQLPPDAKDVVFLLVPGLMGNQYPGYMAENLKALRQAGAEARMVPTNTVGGVAENAERMFQALRAVELREPGKKVVFITHSMGGLDVTAALALHPEMARVVRGVVAIQPPYGGSPVAQDLVADPKTSNLARFAFDRVLGGDYQALKDLSYDERQKFVREHPYPADLVPTITVASSRPPAESGLLVASSRYMQQRYGVESDGLVAKVDAEIPGSSVVRLDDLDHANPAFRDVFGGSHYQPGELTLALATQVLNATR